MSSFPKRILLSLSAGLLLAAGLVSQPAQAWNFSYWPMRYPGYWIWPLSTNIFSLTNPYVSYQRAVTFPYRAMTGSTGYYHSPYSWNPALVDPSTGKTNNLGPFSYGNNYEPPLANMGVYPYGPGAFSQTAGMPTRDAIRAQDQALLEKANAALNPNQPPSGQFMAAAPQGASQTAPQFPPAAPPVQGQSSPGMLTMPNGSPAAPPVVLSPNSSFAPGQAPGGQSPWQDGLTQLFVTQVNKKFKGNIKNALFDPETRSLARAIGLVGPDDVFDADLSASRVALAKHILGDSSLDGAHKLDALRAVLRR